MPSLGVSYEFKTLFPGTWWHRGLLEVPDAGFSSKVEEGLSRGVLSNRQNLKFIRYDTKILHFLSVHWKELSTKALLFLIELDLFNIGG